MTDLQGDVLGSNLPGQVAPVVSESSAVPSSEKLFKQSEVNSLVGREKHEAVESYKRRQAQEVAQTAVQTAVSPHEPPITAGVAQQSRQSITDATELKRMIAEGVQTQWNEQLEHVDRMRQEQDAKRIAADFFTKLSTGKEKYQDYDTKVGKLNFQSIPQVVGLATGVDNTADVMYELASNPSKIANLLVLANLPGGQELAHMEMQKLSQSIKDNHQAANHKSPREPLSQLRPTNTGTDNGKLSVSDYRKRYKV